MAEIANSSFLDFTSFRTTSATDPYSAYGIDPADVVKTGTTVNVALVLDRANDPTALLGGDWASRQKALIDLKAKGALWSTYGADPAAYQEVVNGLGALGIPLLGDATGSAGYVSSVESRTIWVTLNSENFEKLFGTPLLRVASGDDEGLIFWNGNLSLPNGWDVGGIWPDVESPHAVSNLAGNVSAALPQGPQSIGNSSTVKPAYFAQEIGRQFYNFPETWASQATGTIGLIEPGVGSALPDDVIGTFGQLLDGFREKAGITTPGSTYTQNAAGQYYTGSAGERSLDVGVVASAAPGSTIGLYVGSGLDNDAHATTYTAYQAAFWDTVHNPAVVSSSFGGPQRPAPGSPFSVAANELFVDAALRNISVYAANGDGGSGGEIGTGLTNLYGVYMSPYNMMVGGTAVSSPAQAAADATLTPFTDKVAAGDLATLWQLVCGGLTALPAAGSLTTREIETVWNSYLLSGSLLDPGYLKNDAGSGGADPSHPIPGYQLAYGLHPVTADPLAEPGRGTPEVSALAGGGMFYKTPHEDMTGISDDFGTSAATPFWASIAAHINAEFAAIGLPQLGYANDLFYIASVVAPASFNDITVGNNVSTYIDGGPLTAPIGKDGATATLTPTGYGNEAAPGYDLATGLGTPNAALLARSLSAIATSQYYFDTPDVLAKGSAGWTSPVDQSLIFQSALAADTSLFVGIGTGGLQVAGTAGGAFAWTSQFAQQTLQSDFSSELVTLFDKQAQGSIVQADVESGDAVSVAIGGATVATPQATLSAPYGFVDFVASGSGSTMRAARAVAVAETAKGADDEDAIVRLRQNGENDQQVMFYRVDDYAGKIGDLSPGDPGYDIAALARAYQDETGEIWLQGGGYGEYTEAEITGVDAGSLIAMALKSAGHTYYAFAEANEEVDGAHVPHLWSYGLNTWGWEDLFGGGDRDYNDLVVQLDFTGAAKEVG
ncbi:DUF4114 domain-containing protein [Chelatococcus reniformis]|uniref:Peptidase S53 domain-containing protein n=1 Tax=Chelatococcus reniformis TaxID=1494448 RepID=A0A916UQ84_9HYPH|nr:DUF4114 domain-containing protein [Chelatococcus reniformis]GGC79780.1 hypothetical protein GCM10010994_42270 [Chelatococcus reniformis]